jgi:hypothetical protein
MGLRAVDFAQGALIAGFASVLWEELVARSPSVLNDDTAYRFGFLFVIVMLWKVVRARRAREAAAHEEHHDAGSTPADTEEKFK